MNLPEPTDFRAPGTADHAAVQDDAVPTTPLKRDTQPLAPLETLETTHLPAAGPSTEELIQVEIVNIDLEAVPPETAPQQPLTTGGSVLIDLNDLSRAVTSGTPLQATPETDDLDSGFFSSEATESALVNDQVDRAKQREQWIQNFISKGFHLSLGVILFSVMAAVVTTISKNSDKDDVMEAVTAAADGSGLNDAEVGALVAAVEDVMEDTGQPDAEEIYELTEADIEVVQYAAQEPVAPAEEPFKPYVSNVNISTIDIAVKTPGAIVSDSSQLTVLNVSRESLIGTNLRVITERDGLKMYDENGVRINVGNNFAHGSFVTVTDSEPRIFTFSHPITGMATDAVFIEVTNGTQTGYSLAGYFAKIDEETEEDIVEDTASPDEIDPTPDETTTPDILETPIWETEEPTMSLEPTTKNDQIHQKALFETPKPVTYTTKSGKTGNYNFLGTETITHKDGTVAKYAILGHPNSNLQFKVSHKTLAANPNSMRAGEFVEFDEVSVDLLRETNGQNIEDILQLI